MSRFFEDVQQQRIDQHVAQELGVTVETLDNHPYELDENATNDGAVTHWRVLWLEMPPPGVKVYGPERGRWSDINVLHERP